MYCWMEEEMQQSPNPLFLRLLYHQPLWLYVCHDQHEAHYQHEQCDHYLTRKMNIWTTCVEFWCVDDALVKMNMACM